MIDQIQTLCNLVEPFPVVGKIIQISGQAAAKIIHQIFDLHQLLMQLLQPFVILCHTAQTAQCPSKLVCCPIPAICKLLSLMERFHDFLSMGHSGIIPLQLLILSDTKSGLLDLFYLIGQKIHLLCPV